MRLGLLTGGGDAPGLNAAIRAVVRSAAESGDEVIGVRNGWAGLMGEGDLCQLTRPDVAGILREGGTILGTSSGFNPLVVPGGPEAVENNIARAGIDVLLAVGGDGTLGMAAGFAHRGVPVVGLPKTIDNDLSATDYCIGFDSAVSRVAEALDRLHTTAASHHRVMVVETMGRDVGWLAVVGGLAGGADLVLIPEVDASLEDVVAHLDARYRAGSDFSIVVVAEGVRLEGVASTVDPAIVDSTGKARLARRATGEALAEMIETRTGHETRATVLGHTQRGGSPTAFDRVWATRVAVGAHHLARAGRTGRVAIVSGEAVGESSLEEVARKRCVPPDVYGLAQLFF